MFVAEVFQVDGNPTFVVGKGSPLGDVYTPNWVSAGQKITFRARAYAGPIDCFAGLTVFYE
jgi:hypothetical protein